jgi:cobalt ECF transporter T component CbiQ
VKLAGLFGLIVCVAFARNAATMLAIFALAVALGAASSRTVMALVARVWISVVAFTIVIAVPSLFLTRGDIVWKVPVLDWPVTLQGLRTASYLVLRVGTSATLASLLVFTTPWPHVLKALRTFRVPAVFVLVLGMAYRYVLLLLETARDMYESHRSRAVGALPVEVRRHVAVNTAGVLLSKTFQLSDDVYLAMQARVFRGDVHVFDDFRMAALDWIALSGFAASIAIAAWAGR